VRLPKDILNFGLYTKPNFYLCETNKEKICKLETTETKGSFKFNSMSELSFETARIYNDLITGETRVNPFYNKIEALRLIYIEDIGYFELQGPELISDGISEKKSCKAYSLEYTLAQKYLDNFRVNMGTVDSIEVMNASSDKSIVPIVLYNPSNPKLSLLHLALEKIYGWKIGHVDASLRTLSRQFDIDRESVYDFLMNEVCEKFNCYIVFDTITNTINVYAESLTAKFIGDGHTNTFTISPPFAQIGTVSVDGYKTTRWHYNVSTGALMLDDVPESGAHIEIVDGALTEWETDVFVSFDNLAQEANISYNSDDIKTQLTVTYGDDYDIREINLGMPYITDISYYYTVDWMGQDLYDAYTKYMQKSNNSQTRYTNNSQEILRLNDHIAYEENRLSLEYSLAESVNSTTVGTYYTRQKNLDGSYYYSEVSLPSEYVVGVNYYSNVTTNVNEEKVRSLYNVLQHYFYAYFNGKAENIVSALDELNELLGFEFMETYTLSYLHDALKTAQSITEMDTAIHNFLNEMWIELGRTPLKELYLNPYKRIQETNIEAGWSNKSNENYGNYYPATLLITSIENTIAIRDKTINGYKNEQSVFQKANAAISDSLSMPNNFTEDQLIRLSAFLREDELHLEDIVETSIDDLSSSFKIKQDAAESGRIELQKICQPQLQFSMTMANIYALPEFEPIINQFQLGKVVKVSIRPDYIKQSRLLQVDINFDDFSDFACDFGELTSLRTQSDIHADLLSQAITAGKSVATNSGYWTRGSDQATALDLKIQQGLLDATTQIKAMDGSQGVVIDKYGIKLQRKLDNGELDPRQTWLVNNMILMSDDGFKTSRSALGEVTVDGATYYGLIAEMVLSGYIEGSIIKGGTIQIGEYTDDNGNKKYAFEVDKNGNVTMTSGNIDGYATSEALSEVKKTADGLTSAVYDENGESRIEQTAQSISLKVGYDDIISAINMSEEGIKINADKITIDAADLSIDASNIALEGLVTANENFKVLLDGSIEAKNATISGDISASTIKGSTIEGGSLLIGDKESGSYAEITSDGILDCNGASITGTIIATAGNIGGCEIFNSQLQVPAANITGELTASQINTTGLIAENISGTTIEGKTIIGGSLLIGSKDVESPVYAEITQDGILNCVGANITGTINATDGTFTGTISGSTITGGSLLIGKESDDDDTYYAEITSSGMLKCRKATIGVGSSIGGFKTDSNSLFKGNWTSTKTPTVFMCTGSTGNLTLAGRTGDGWCFGAGENFGVTIDGDLYAARGKIGGWNMGEIIINNYENSEDVTVYSGCALYSDPYIEPNNPQQYEVSVALTPTKIFVYGQDERGANWAKSLTWYSLLFK
jgi:hypothetical protein